MNVPVLVIDDDTWMAAHHVRVLTKAGYVAQSAHNALEAIDSLDVVKPRVIVLDMLMPGANGVVLLHEMQSHADLAEIPVVVVTNSEGISLSSLRSYGVVEILNKATMQPDDVVRTVRKVTS